MAGAFRLVMTVTARDRPIGRCLFRSLLFVGARAQEGVPMKTMIVLALLIGATFFSAVNANAQGCPSGQRSMGRCLAGPPKPQPTAKPAPRGCTNRVMGRCVQ